MPLNPITGAQCKLVFGTAIPGVTALDFLSETLTSNETQRDSTGLRGTRTRYWNRNRRTGFTPGGSLVMEPNYIELAAMLPYALGGTPAGTSYPMGELLSAFTLQFLKGNYTYNYTGCKVARMAIRGTKGAQVQVTYDILALAEARAAAGTFPSLTISETTKAPIFEELVLTVAGSLVTVFDFLLTIDNGAAPRQVNSLNPTAIISHDRSVSLAINLPAGDHEDLFGLTDEGVEAVAAFVTGGTALTLTMPNVAFPRQTPNAAGRTELVMPMVGQARGSAPGNELVVVLDSTP